MDGQEIARNHEREIKSASGWPMLFITILLFVAAAVLYILSAVLNDRGTIGGGSVLGMVIAGSVLLVVGIFLCPAGAVKSS